MKTAVSYIRVSTARQGRSGLGLEAQQAALARFAEAEGYSLIETFQEVETGKGAENMGASTNCEFESQASAMPKSAGGVRKLGPTCRLRLRHPLKHSSHYFEVPPILLAPPEGIEPL